MKRKAGATLSVCLIVKDEQSYLAPCLQSIKALADEIVVVDTGSTDRTGDIARIFGAKVFDYQWNDDFAAARNFGLEKANGDWILIMDADEIISRKDHAKFLHFCRQLPEDGHFAFLMTTLNFTDQRESAGWVKDDNHYPEIQAEGWVPTEKVRLFPNHHHIRFVYPVHEVVDPVLKEYGYRVERCPVPVLHFGKLNHHRKRERWQSYYRIGKKKLNCLGDHPSALRELAIQAALLNRLEEASDLWRRFIRLRPDSINGWTNLASVYSRLGSYQQASEAAHKAAQLAPDKIEALYNLVISELQIGDVVSAIKASNRLVGRFPDYVPGHMLAAISHVCGGKWEVGIEMLKHAQTKTTDQVLRQMIVEISAPLRHAGRHDWIKDICRAFQHAT
jgi:glycosyltransferase involved in cell wall biosynthesis